MDKSLYFDVIANLFPHLMVQIIEEKKGNPDYSFLERLGEEYSVDGTFEVLTGSKRTIKADIVAMDSPLPLKSRPTLGAEYGKVPKIGQSRVMRESDLKRLDVMISKFGNDSSKVRDAVANDSISNIDGILDTMQELYLKGLSAGVVNIGADNAGLTEIRLDYGFKADQKGYASVVWGSGAYTPITDIQKIVDQARDNGTRLTEIHMDNKSLSDIIKSDEVKGLFDKTGLLITESRVRDLFREQLGLDLNVVTRVIKSEIDGVVTQTPAWERGMITFTQSGELGTVFYTDTAEHNHRAENVIYSEPNEYILASMYRTVRPLNEWAEAQCMALPVITDVENIYQLDTTKISA